MHNIYVINIVVVIAVVDVVDNVGKLNKPHYLEKIYLFLPVDKLLVVSGNFCGFQHPKFLTFFPSFINNFYLENFAVENSAG